jgi:hypothetical protein
MPLFVVAANVGPQHSCDYDTKDAYVVATHRSGIALSAKAFFMGRCCGLRVRLLGVSPRVGDQSSGERRPTRIWPTLQRSRPQTVRAVTIADAARPTVPKELGSSFSVSADASGTSSAQSR